MNLKENLAEVEKEIGVGDKVGGKKDDYFVFEKGGNTIRILTEWVPIYSHYVNGKNYTCYGEDEGCKYHGADAPLNEKGNPQRARVRFVTYVLSRKDNQVYLAFLPYSIVKDIVTLSEDPNWAFTQFPMPYDLNVTYNPDAAPADKYKVVPSPKMEEVESPVLNILLTKKHPSEIVERIKEKAKTK